MGWRLQMGLWLLVSTLVLSLRLLLTVELAVARFWTFYCLPLNTSLLSLDVIALEHNTLEPIPLELQPVVWNSALFSANNPAPPGTALGLKHVTSTVNSRSRLCTLYLRPVPTWQCHRFGGQSCLGPPFRAGEQALPVEVPRAVDNDELESLKNESDTFSVERRNKVEQELKDKREDAAALTEVCQTGE